MTQWWGGNPGDWREMPPIEPDYSVWVAALILALLLVVVWFSFFGN